MVRHSADRLVAFFQGAAFQKLFKDLGLEDLDQLELATPLHLEALELGQRAVVVEDGVALLQQLV